MMMNKVRNKSSTQAMRWAKGAFKAFLGIAPP
jgi:hypothetical protein